MSKVKIKNEEAVKVINDWRKNKGNLLYEHKNGSIIFKKDVNMPKQIWTEEQAKDLDKRFDNQSKDLKAYTDSKFDDMKNYTDKRFEETNKRFDETNHKVDELKDLIKLVIQKLDDHITTDHQK